MWHLLCRISQWWVILHILLENLRSEVGLFFRATSDLLVILKPLGLAEGLRNEFQLYGISIHIYHPSTIYSPGYVQENQTKPPVTLKIEESDSGMTPEQAAKGILECKNVYLFHIYY